MSEVLTGAGFGGLMMIGMVTAILAVLHLQRRELGGYVSSVAHAVVSAACFGAALFVITAG